MAENLNYNASGSLCYDNNQANCKKYGRLYNWETAKKACPAGWHLPSKEEWEGLVNNVSNAMTAGAKLKTGDGWDSNEGKSGNGSDDYDFSALPSGLYESGTSQFGAMGVVTAWWTSTEHDKNYAYFSLIANQMDAAFTVAIFPMFDLPKSSGFSVRCVKN